MRGRQLARDERRVRGIRRGGRHALDGVGRDAGSRERGERRHRRRARAGVAVALGPEPGERDEHEVRGPRGGPRELGQLDARARRAAPRRSQARERRERQQRPRARRCSRLIATTCRKAGSTSMPLSLTAPLGAASAAQARELALRIAVARVDQATAAPARRREQRHEVEARELLGRMDHGHGNPPIGAVRIDARGDVAYVAERTPHHVRQSEQEIRQAAEAAAKRQRGRDHREHVDLRRPHLDRLQERHVPGEAAIHVDLAPERHRRKQDRDRIARARELAQLLDRAGLAVREELSLAAREVQQDERELERRRRAASRSRCSARSSARRGPSRTARGPSAGCGAGSAAARGRSDGKSSQARSRLSTPPLA